MDLQRRPAPRTPLLAGVLLGPVLLAVLTVAGPAREVLDVRIFVAAVALVAVVGAGLIIVHVEPVWTLTAGLLLSVFSGQWQQLGIPLPLDRLLLIAGIAAAVYRNRRAEHPVRLAMTRTTWLLVAAAVYAIGSALLSGTILEEEPLFALADNLPILGFFVFALAPLLFSAPESRAVVLAALVGLGAYLGATAVLEQVAPALVFPSYITNPDVGIHYERSRGPFVEAAAMGLALHACGVAAVMAWRLWQPGWGRNLAAVTAVLCGVGIVFTLTRQVWLGAALSTLVTMAAVPALRRFVLPTIVATTLLVGALVVALPPLREQLQERATEQRPVWDRLNSNRAGVDMVIERPLFGFGWFAFGEDGLRYYRQSPDYPLTTTIYRIHNVYLSRAVELGIVGMALWLAAFLAGMTAALRPRPGPPDIELWRIGLFAILACWAVVANFTPLQYSFSNMLPWIWAGVIVAAVRPAAREATPAATPARVPASLTR
jgi:O-antigen ligase